MITGNTAGAVWRVSPDGAQVWCNEDVDASGTTLPALLRGSPVLVVITPTSVAGLSRDNGTLLWQVPTAGTQEVVVVDTSDVAYVADGRGRVYAVSGANGTVVWTSSPCADGAAASVSALTSTGRLLVTCSDGSLLALA
jgi:outer membrane protein assembly factor BamB